LWTLIVPSSGESAKVSAFVCPAARLKHCGSAVLYPAGVVVSTMQ
jgi:hypothetical protein